MKQKNDAKLEKLSKAIQKNLDGNPAILIESGGSIPYGLPSMADLADKIIAELSDKYLENKTWRNHLLFHKELDTKCE